MGAASRKINNARGTQEFNEATDVYGKAKAIGDQPYSQADTDALRTRALRPIQAAYGRAGEELNRSRALGGGYAPNFGAVVARMTRDRTGQLDSALNDVNAGIASDSINKRLAGYGLANDTIRTQQNTPKNEGFPWAKVLGGIASFGGSLLGGALSRKKDDDPFAFNPKPSRGVDPYANAFDSPIPL